MNVYIREKDLDYSAMRGPCPEGFHIPSKDDWGAIVGIWEGLGLSVDSGGALFSSYLKMPFAGERTGAGTLREQGSFVYGWSCTNSNEQIYFLRVGRYGGIHYTTISGRGMGYSLRAFKDAPVKPDSSWTVIYDGSAVATGAGIFYNATLGLISLSSDGFSRKTIQDKNLGAENVGDYGSLFQRGNNYGFPSTGTLSDTSDTQVDASSYGPGNYYSSSTYITTSESPYDRSSVRNDNLWGWNTGTSPIMTTMKNAYVGGYYEQTYTIPLNTSGRLLLSKTGWKVKKVVFELAISGTSSSRRYPKIYAFSDAAETTGLADIGINLPSGSEWGTTYSGYTGGNIRYGGIYSDTNMNVYLDFPSSASANNQISCRLEVTENSCTVQVGKVYGTRLYENTRTPSSVMAEGISTCFNCEFLKTSHPSTSNTIQRKNIIVAYEPIV